MEQLAQRGVDFLNALTQSISQNQERPVLAVSHGLFLRVLQAVYHGVPVRQIEKMENAEVRILHLQSDMTFSTTPLDETGGTAN